MRVVLFGPPDRARAPRRCGWPPTTAACTSPPVTPCAPRSRPAPSSACGSQELPRAAATSSRTSWSSSCSGRASSRPRATPATCSTASPVRSRQAEAAYRMGDRGRRHRPRRGLPRRRHRRAGRPDAGPGADRGPGRRHRRGHRQPAGGLRRADRAARRLLRAARPARAHRCHAEPRRGHPGHHRRPWTRR